MSGVLSSVHQGEVTERGRAVCLSLTMAALVGSSQGGCEVELETKVICLCKFNL